MAMQATGNRLCSGQQGGQPFASYPVQAGLALDPGQAKTGPELPMACHRNRDGAEVVFAVQAAPSSISFFIADYASFQNRSRA